MGGFCLYKLVVRKISFLKDVSLLLECSNKNEFT